MNVHYIYKQKIAEIEARLPISISKKNKLDDNNFPKEDRNSDKEPKFNTILNNIINKASNLSSETNIVDNAKKSIGDFAKKYLNIPYVWGGNTTNGFDCSGFTKYVIKNFGVNIDRVSKDQAQNGEFVAKDKLKEGDLVFFNTKGDGVSHVGIYIGNGEFVHASSAAKKIVISKLDKGYYNETYVTGRRVLNG